jgi:UDPglucose--hexose-1-phosphate uridylyltransferase
MADFNLADYPHRRYNPLTREWILVSPQRTKRPWLGQVERSAEAARPSYDPTCYLCPGNARVGGARNPSYTGTYVFDNDFAALQPDAPAGEHREADLLVAQSERGLCRVVCFSPDHSLTLAQMAEEAILGVVETWVAQCNEIGRLPWVRYVQIFENKGAIMGCSNPHPHGQIWASAALPQQVAVEQEAQASYRTDRGTCLLCDYLALECVREERLVCANAGWLAVVPFWATWPFETLLLPRRHVGALTDLSATERSDLANLLKRLTVRYDNLFETSFPYTLGPHQRPNDGQPHPEWHLHLHVYPPLLRSATVKKFMVGYEMLANPQRDLTPEAAALRLRALAETRFAS